MRRRYAFLALSDLILVDYPSVFRGCSPEPIVGSAYARA